MIGVIIGDFNPQAVGRDSGVPFSLINFLADLTDVKFSKL